MSFDPVAMEQKFRNGGSLCDMPDHEDYDDGECPECLNILIDLYKEHRTLHYHVDRYELSTKFDEMIKKGVGDFGGAFYSANRMITETVYKDVDIHSLENKYLLCKIALAMCSWEWRFELKVANRLEGEEEEGGQ
ncbi:MAG: hypothetical protein U9R75_11310 [Candidatus Thermoplasmatota archaeon]|nr:hypothetical protein [Candidatus Thermoplasmatota archaeon]